ncbi:MAG: Gfo/Idh/MocA family oxidoreductase [Leptospirales bacterium]|nr:Gfo/Idh/MocA family oxidoreductase [Leptospirales bacterium]
MIERIVIAGYGSIGARHLRIARSLLPQADIRVLRRDTAYEPPSESNGLLNSYSDACAFKPQLTVVCGPATMHCAAIECLLPSETNFLIEKPLAADSESGRKIERSLRAGGRIAQLGYNLRYSTALQEFKKLIDSSEIGKVRFVQASVGQWLPSWRPGRDYRQSVSARSELGGGALLELSHELDYLRWIFGEFAWIQSYSAHLSDLQINVEDCASLVAVTHSSGDMQQTLISLNLDFLQRTPARMCLAIGEYGSLRWNAVSDRVERSEDAAGWKTVYAGEQDADGSYRAEWRALLESIKKGEDAKPGLDDGVRALCYVEAARKSAETGQRISPATLDAV